LKSSNNPGQWKDLILVGRIVGVHGVRGNLKIHSYAASTAVYEAAKDVVVGSPDGSFRAMTVNWVRPHGRSFLMNFEAVTDRAQAENLVGASLFQKKSVLPILEEDTYYWFELVGLQVYDVGGEFLGRLDSVIPTAGNDIYVVRKDLNGRASETLIPAVGEVILDVDLAKGTMTVDPPEGL